VYDGRVCDYDVSIGLFAGRVRCCAKFPSAYVGNNPLNATDPTGEQTHRTRETPHGVPIRTNEEQAAARLEEQRQEFQVLVDKHGGTPPGDAARVAMGQDISVRNPMMTPAEAGQFLDW